jgi:3-deoxy-manno-octulosonate cytidylyltransferase (CMP-KDO synthetase)
MQFIVIIPARFASTRLPGKPLKDLHGKPMIQWVIERSRASGAARVIVATDHEEIAAVSRSCGAEICFTGRQHRNGTERLAEAVLALDIRDDEIVANVQGDEPLINPALVSATAHHLASSSSDVATVATRLSSWEEYEDPNVVKVVMDADGNASYFSRAPIPAVRDGRNSATFPSSDMLRHVGLYVYRSSVLRKYAGWAESPLERMEKLEQLRLLYNGAKIQVVLSNATTGPSIDTMQDLERARGLGEEDFRAGL